MLRLDKSCLQSFFFSLGGGEGFSTLTYLLKIILFFLVSIYKYRLVYIIIFLFLIEHFTKASHIKLFILRIIYPFVNMRGEGQREEHEPDSEYRSDYLNHHYKKAVWSLKKFFIKSTDLIQHFQECFCKNIL